MTSSHTTTASATGPDGPRRDDSEPAAVDHRPDGDADANVNAKAGKADGEGESTLTVVLALLANLGVAVAKLVAGLITGSGALLSEAAHSVGDSGRK